MNRLVLMSEQRERRDRWTKRWFYTCKLFASWSKDPKRGVGAVIVNDRNTQVAGGWNGLPRGVDDLPERYEPEVKKMWCEHAERNAIYGAASEGIATRGTTMFSIYFPCSDCARGIIQSGIAHLVTIEPDWLYAPRQEDWAVSAQMLAEADVKVTFAHCN